MGCNKTFYVCGLVQPSEIFRKEEVICDQKVLAFQENDRFSISLVDDLEAKYCNAIGRHQLTLVRKQQVTKSKTKGNKEENYFYLQDKTKVVEKLCLLEGKICAFKRGQEEFLQKSSLGGKIVLKEKKKGCTFEWCLVSSQKYTSLLAGKILPRAVDLSHRKSKYV